MGRSAQRVTLMLALLGTASALPIHTTVNETTLASPDLSDAAQSVQALQCTGPGCWSCKAPLESTKCVKSSWIGWKGDRDKFQAECKGNLVRWGDDSGVQDCGVACWGCSFIRACCDTCKIILAVEGSYVPLGCTSVAKDVSQTTGVTVSTSSSWSRTEEWSSSVSSKVSASGVVEGITGSVELSAETKHSLSITMSSSWSKTQSTSTTIKFTQPANTCAWGFQWKITDSCGIKYARSNDFVTTDTGKSPCCLPFMEDKKTGKCIADNAGHIVNLCTAT